MRIKKGSSRTVRQGRLWRKVQSIFPHVGIIGVMLMMVTVASVLFIVLCLRFTLNVKEDQQYAHFRTWFELQDISLPVLSNNSSATVVPIEPEEMSFGEWRATAESECRSALQDLDKTGDKAEALRQKLQLERKAIRRLSLPETTTNTRASTSSKSKYDYCKNTFIDLGTNIGDSIGHFIDNALDVCTPLWLYRYPKQKINKEFPRPHLNVTGAEIYNRGLGKSNPLFGMLQRQMTKFDHHHGTQQRLFSEDFCVYGMEGNPIFTERLQRLQNFIMDIHPRPVQHLHIHTESVVSATDGPTKLYLDKTSVKQNFWGSSILSSQQDAIKSAKALNNGQVFSADVKGIRLTTLIRSTMAPFSSLAASRDKTGGLIIVKMDVEGAEYQIIKEVAASGVLCDYIKMGNRVYFIVEYHNRSITDPKQRKREKDGHQAARKQLESCGVEFGKLQAFWH